jgi:hypothetical protein
MRYSGASSQRPRELIPAGRGDLLIKGGHTHYVYEGASGRRPARLVRSTNTGEAPHAFVRSPLIDKVDALAGYAGRYGSDELAHDLEIRVEGGSLVAGAVAGATGTAPFQPVARDLFATPEIGWKVSDNVGWRFERDPRGKVVRVVASTDRAREVVLVRR